MKTSIMIIAAPVAAVVIGVMASYATPIQAQEAYTATIRKVAGGPELPEVLMFEDNFSRCYISDHGMGCLKK